MSSSNGRHKRYAVEMTGRANDEYRAAIVAAEAAARGRSVYDAMQEIWDRLSDDPRAFGELLYVLRKMRMEVHCGSVAPVYVEYGVHEQQPLVVIRRVVWLKGSTES